MSPLSPAGPLDVRPVLRPERSSLIELLGSLGDDDWHRPTECPAYDVQGVAAHLLGDDLSLLSRQRDSAPPGVFSLWQPGEDFRVVLDRFNDRWVDASQFFSAAVLIDLLELAGGWTADWYDRVDPESLGEPVGFFAATGPSPYWQIAAREYVERWVHHHQIRRALGVSNVDALPLLHAAIGVVVRSLAMHLRDLGTETGDSLVLAVSGLGEWSLVRDGDRWQAFEGRPDHPTAELGLDSSLATRMSSLGGTATEVENAFVLRGDVALAGRAARAVAAMGR